MGSALSTHLYEMSYPGVPGVLRIARGYLNRGYGFSLTDLLWLEDPSDGGSFSDISWERVRFSSFYSYHEEKKDGAVFDFEGRHRDGLSQLSNIRAGPSSTTRIFGILFGRPPRLE